MTMEIGKASQPEASDPGTHCVGTCTESRGGMWYRESLKVVAGSNVSPFQPTNSACCPALAPQQKVAVERAPHACAIHAAMLAMLALAPSIYMSMRAQHSTRAIPAVPLYTPHRASAHCWSVVISANYW